MKGSGRTEKYSTGQQRRAETERAAEAVTR